VACRGRGGSVAKTRAPPLSLPLSPPKPPPPSWACLWDPADLSGWADLARTRRRGCFGRRGASWARAYFRLRGAHLFWFPDDAAPSSALGVVNIQSCSLASIPTGGPRRTPAVELAPLPARSGPAPRAPLRFAPVGGAAAVAAWTAMLRLAAVPRAALLADAAAGGRLAGLVAAADARAAGGGGVLDAGLAVAVPAPGPPPPAVLAPAPSPPPPAPRAREQPPPPRAPPAPPPPPPPAATTLAADLAHELARRAAGGKGPPPPPPPPPRAAAA